MCAVQLRKFGKRTSHGRARSGVYEGHASCASRPWKQNLQRETASFLCCDGGESKGEIKCSQPLRMCTVAASELMHMWSVCSSVA